MIISQRINSKSTPSFQARLVKGKGAQRVIKTTLTDFYNGCIESVRKDTFGDEPLDVRREYKDFQNAFKEITRGIGGKVKLFPHESKDFPGEFVDLVLFRKGKNPIPIGFNIPSSLIRRSAFFDHGKPHRDGVELVVASCADGVAKKGAGYTKDNKFHMLFMKLMKK